MEERDSEIRQRSASVFNRYPLRISSKMIFGTAGENDLILITTACPQVGILDAEKIIKYDLNGP